MADTSKAAVLAKARRPRVKTQKVQPFARYKGTSAWTKNRRRVRTYAWFRAEEQRKQSEGSLASK